MNMNEDEFSAMLTENEPPVPEVDREQVVGCLSRRTRVTSGLRTRKPVFRLLVGLAACAAGALAAPQLPRWSPSPDQDSPQVSLEMKLNQSQQSSDALERELRQLLASSAAPDSHRRDDFLNLKAKLRASESLWIMADDSNSARSAASQTIITLYPDTPAAERCLELAAN